MPNQQQCPAEKWLPISIGIINEWRLEVLVRQAL